ncbi:MAG: NAD(P)/FAD-dependent oxidoreductase [Candidatus Caldarchaeum sp.]|nr:NAD(P)/FAD-dependent oxidoreductase [Candidatus Caldarchaeum sp.]MCS7129026.1 NAD(P)/FAD-dependent oxidoreductase [Candidatus Caldarchaeum sp.]MDW8359570.1 NAD(P)/FAD-dependent oxidoreductase [Candidatus Caldarchaeum sp.]
MKEHDVIVVGGGPAGVSAAKAAAAGNVDVLLLEKYPTIMANKPCGEAVSKETLATAGVKPSPRIVMHEAYALVYSPSLIEVKIPQIGYNINKSLFIQEIAAQAAEYGADIHVREEVSAVVRQDSKYVVKTSRETYQTKVVIGADGYNSIVARSLGVSERPEPIPTVQYIMANCKLKHPDAVRFYLGNRLAPGGYAWIFPRSEKLAEVGIGVRGGVAKEYLDAFVRKFSDELASARIIDYRGAPVPIGGAISESVFDGAMLVGDAAGHVIPLTGAGIHSSVAAGLAAGRVAADAVKEGDTSKQRLSQFYKLYENWLSRINRSLKAMRAVEKLSDEELDTLARIFQADDILDLANGLDLGRVARKLLSHPVLAVKLARQLL